jgi:hypothetical protein
MTSIAADVLVSLVALVTTAPGLVALRPSLAVRLYAIDVATLPRPVAVVLLHRAAFFAIVASMLAASIVVESWRGPALFAALASKLAFVALATRHRTLASIARTDVVLLAMLGGAAALDAL